MNTCKHPWRRTILLWGLGVVGWTWTVGEASPASPAVGLEQRLTLDFRNTEAPDIFRAIAALTGINVVVDPAVKGALSLTLHEVPVEEALQAVAQAANLHLEQVEHVYHVRREPLPPRPRIEMRDGRVTVDVENFPLPELLRQLAAQAGWSLVPEAEVQGTVTLHAQGLSAEAALTYILEANGLEKREREGVWVIAKKPPPPPVPPPEPAHRIERDLNGTVSLDLEEQPLPQVLRQLAEVGGLNVVPQPDVQGKVTLRLRGLPAEAALQVLLKTAGLTGQNVEGVWIVSKTPPEPEPRKVPFRLEVAAGMVTLDAEDQPVAQLLRELAAQGQRNIVPAADVQSKLTLHLQGVPVETALQVILKMAHLNGVQEGEVWLVSQAPPPQPEPPPLPFTVEVAAGRATLDVQDQPVKDVLRRLGELSNLNIVPEADLAAKVTLHLEGVPVETAFRVLVDLSHLQTRQVGGIWEVFQQLPAEPAAPPLVVEVEQGQVTLEVQEQPLGEVLRRLARAAKLNLLPDPGLTQPVTLHVHGLPVPQVLQILTETYHLTQRQVGEVVLLAQGERGEEGAGSGGKGPERAGGGTEPGEGPPRPPDRVRLDVENAGLAEVLEIIREQTGAQILVVEGLPGGSSWESPSLGAGEYESGRSVRNGGSVGSRKSVGSAGSGMSVGGGKKGEAEKEPSPSSPSAPPPSGSPSSPPSASVPFRPLPSAFSLSLRLDDVTIEEALATVLRGTGYTFKEIDGRYYIGRADDLQSPAASLFVTTGTVPLKYLQAQDAVTLVSALVPKDRVQALPEQNTLLVVGTAEQIARVREEVARIDLPAPQISIETLLVELSEQASKELGVTLKWAKDSWQVRVPLVGDLIFRDTGGLGKVFEGTLQALLDQGQATVLAKPRVAVINGETANIDIDQLRYFRTGTITTGTGVGSRAEDSQTAIPPYYPISQIDRIEAGIKLEITPWVGAAGEITVKVTPEVSGITGVGPEGLPEVNRRTATTTLRVKDGESIVIGGLRQQEETKSVTRTPLLSELPLIGPLFRQTKTSRRETELLIVLTPHLLGGAEGGKGEP